MTESGRLSLSGEHDRPKRVPVWLIIVFCRLVEKVVRVAREDGVERFDVRVGSIHMLEEHDRALSVVAIDKQERGSPSRYICPFDGCDKKGNKNKEELVFREEDDPFEMSAMAMLE
jgi:hypothetical protein